MRTIRLGHRSRIIVADVNDALNALDADERYELIIADPPYNLGKDFGTTKDRMDPEAYVEWTWGWLGPCLNRLAEDGMAYVYGVPEILARIAARHPIDRQRWLQWHYANRTAPGSRFWQRSHESIVALWPGAQRPALRIDDIREPYRATTLRSDGKPRRGTPGRYGRTGRTTTYRNHPQGALPRDVIQCPALAGGAGRRERWFHCRTHQGEVLPAKEINRHRHCDTLHHPTQKPEGLTERLIRSKIAPGGRERILIPFAGAGTEAAVAHRLAIGFTAIELNPEYAALTAGRVQQTAPEATGGKSKP